MSRYALTGAFSIARTPTGSPAARVLAVLNSRTALPVRHRKRMIIKKGCDCEWCEAVSWDVVGELRDTCEKLQQSLMMRGTRTPMIVSKSLTRAPREKKNLSCGPHFILSLSH